MRAMPAPWTMLASTSEFPGPLHRFAGGVVAAPPATEGALGSSVLVLNRVWTAIRVIDARRAFTLLCKDLAEVIRVDDGSYAPYAFNEWSEVAHAAALFDATRGHDDPYLFVRSAHKAIAVPKVIRVLGFDRTPREPVKLNRRNIFARDHHQCQYCGDSFATCDLSLDHVLPRSRGGTNTWENLVCACIPCNTRKGGRTPQEARMPLKRPPAKPRHHPALFARLGAARIRSWQAFLDDAYWSVELKG